MMKDGGSTRISATRSAAPALESPVTSGNFIQHLVMYPIGCTIN